ncbi:DUF5908 family protein [Runella sp.]|uniref:DUF5908 family protein n=1 Tax=Runella sp. TaxID=1960881 RepID=UPI003D0B17B4
MPVEIKELNIRVTVNVSERTAGNQGILPKKTEATTGIDRDAVVAECVEQVMHILHLKNER